MEEGLAQGPEETLTHHTSTSPTSPWVQNCVRRKVFFVSMCVRVGDRFWKREEGAAPRDCRERWRRLSQGKHEEEEKWQPTVDQEEIAREEAEQEKKKPIKIEVSEKALKSFAIIP